MLRASAAAVLLHVRQVRQFAMEKHESVKHARAQLARHLETEAMHARVQMLEWAFWSAFVSGLILTMYLHRLTL